MIKVDDFIVSKNEVLRVFMPIGYVNEYVVCKNKDGHTNTIRLKSVEYVTKNGNKLIKYNYENEPHSYYDEFMNLDAFRRAFERSMDFERRFNF